MKLLKKEFFATSLAATMASALLAIGLLTTARAAPVMVFQADTGNPVDPPQSGWTSFAGTESGNPATWTHTQTIGGITIDLTCNSQSAGNTGWRTRSLLSLGPLSVMYKNTVFAANNLDLKMTGLTAGTTYQCILYPFDQGGNTGDRHWNYSLAGNRTGGVDAGWVNQPANSFTPTANTGIDLASKGIGVLSTTFTATGASVNFFTVSGGVHALAGFELYSVPASALAADAGADKTVSPGAPSVAIGANPVASGGTGPYTYSWSPADGLSSTAVPNPTASPSLTTVYTVQVTDSLSATASDSVTVDYPLAADAGADKLVSPLTPSVTIGATSTGNGGTGPYTYSWSPADGLSSTTDPNPIAAPTETTTYTVTVTDALLTTSTDSVIVTYATPDPNLISVDFVYGGVSGSVVCSENTESTGIRNNASGLTFTGQVGPWNALNLGGNNASVNTASLSSLVDGGGTATSVAFKMGHATSAGAAGGDWRNNGVGTFVTGSLRQEQAYLYYPGLPTANHYYWELTGLVPFAHYQLTMFGNCDSTFTNIAIGNTTVAGVLDAEGDWGWADIQADALGVITGNLLYTQNNNNTRGLYGLQLYKMPVVLLPLVADAGADKGVTPGSPAMIGGSPTASEGTGPYTYLWSPDTGLNDATLPNPTASPTVTTTYSVTVTDSTSPTPQTASDSVLVTFTVLPLVADAGVDKTCNPGSPVSIGGNPAATGGIPDYIYSWTPTTGLSDPNVANPTASPTETTTYTLTVTDMAGTQVTDDVIVTFTVPALVANAGADKVYNPGTPVTLGGSPAATGGSTVYTYSWTPTTGLTGADTANPTASPTATTTYTLTVTDDLGTPAATDEVLVTYIVPNANLVSVDFVYGDLAINTPYSGDTLTTGTLNNNAAGEMYTGQAGAWNALFVGDNNAANNSASKTALTNGGGNTTTVAFKMGTATSAGASGGNWKAGYVETSGGNLREEQAYVYYPQVTANHFNWELTGLSPNAHYRLTLFGNGGDSYTNIANTVAGVLDAEGDWNWADIQADASGVIAGNFLNTASNNDVRLLYGLQAEGTMPLVSTGSAYDTWATTNAGGQTAEKDYNNDGVSNGVAYFMGENGITTNPGVVDGKVAWPYVNSVASYKVQISYDLSPSGWVDVAANDAKLHDTGLGGSVTYDLLPAEQGQLFARLVVTP